MNDAQWDKKEMDDFRTQEVNSISSLPDFPSDGTHKCVHCNMYACSNHHSMTNLTTVFDNESNSPSSSYILSSPRAYRQHLVAIRRQIIKASLPNT